MYTIACVPHNPVRSPGDSFKGKEIGIGLPKATQLES